MKIILIFTIILNSLLLASNVNDTKEREKRIEKQIQKEIETEKKYAKEQTFYNQDNYDFKGAEVNRDSLDSVPEIEVQDYFDMDSVYD